MRHLFYISLLLFWISSAYGQETYADRYTHHFSAEVVPLASSAGVLVAPGVGMYRNGSKIDVGIAAQLYDVWKHGKGLAGGYLSYKYYPNKRKNAFNLYFGYHMLFFSQNWGKRFPIVCDEAADVCKHPNLRYKLENMIGIGFDLQLGNDFFMFNDYSVGIIVDWSTYHDVPIESEIRSTGMIRLGLGYNFITARPK